MALTGAALTPLVYGDYVAVIPTAPAANRTNLAQGIITHNVPFEMIQAISTGFSNSLLLMAVKDAYVGVPGSSAVATPTVPVFNPGLISSSVATFLTSMGWVGASASVIANALITSFFARVASLTQIQMNPILGAAVGTGTVSTVANPDLAGAFTSACSSAIMGQLFTSGYFGTGDIPGAPVTPQMTRLVTNLSTAYGTIVGGVTAVVPYAGAAASSTPLSVPNVGKFL